MQNAAYLSPSSMTRLAITSPYGYALADVYSELIIDLKAIIDHIYRDNIEHIRCQARIFACAWR
ncbi:hypothetical protein [Acidithiobacillus sp.]